MNTECRKDQLLAYLCGELEKSEERAVGEHLAGCDACKKELETVRVFWTSLNQLPQEQPSEAMRDRFYEMLHDSMEKNAKKTPARKQRESVPRWFEWLFPRPVLMRAALAVFLLAGGGLVGYQLRQPVYQLPSEQHNQTELTQLHQEVIAMNRLLAVSLLQQQSASERLKGVSLSYQTEGSDPEITAALLQALKYDPNVNVRLAALDALTDKHSQSPLQKEILESLPKQSSPLVQIEMIDWLIQQGDRQSLDVFRHLLKKPDVNKVVKQRINKGIQELNS